MKINDYLNQTVTVKIDRPLGSKHPKHSFLYEVNYGFIPGTKAPDGEEIDAYLLGPSEAVEEFMGKCVAIIHRTNDDDDKLVIVDNQNENITTAEILRQTHFQEKYFESIIIQKK